MTAIKKNDFIELEYTGKIKEDDFVFDTTDLKTATESGLNDGRRTFEPIVICVGESHVLKGFDKFIEGKEVGEYEFDISAEDGFGKKDAKLVQLISTNKFKKQGINPQPGLQINIDGMVGTIKTVTGGRTIVDFNHPLSGRELHYKINIRKIVTEPKDMVEALFKLHLQITPEVKIEGEKATAMFTLPKVKDIPKEIQDKMVEEITKLVPVKELAFVDKEEKKEEKK